MKSFFFSFITIFCLTGILSAQEKEVIQLSDPIEQTETYSVFGSSFNSELVNVKLNDLITKSDKYDGKTVATEGTIKQVCHKKGCFFKLESEDEQARISFKDYGFFIPTNTAGARVKLNGTFTVKTLSKKEARHFAEDAGNDPEAITGPQKEYALVATSIVIYK